MTVVVEIVSIHFGDSKVLHIKRVLVFDREVFHSDDSERMKGSPPV